MQLATSKDYGRYLSRIESDLQKLYEIAKEARSKYLDPTLEPESHIVKDLGEMVEGLVGPPKISERIRELSEKKIERHEMAFITASDIIYAKYGHTDYQIAAEQAIRTSLAVMTGGITAAPIQGIAKVQIKKNLDNTPYLAIYFAGPIRSAAGTEQALTIVIGDFIRQRLGLDRYKPTNDEIQRFIEEIRLYEREVNRFQYHISDEELEFALKNFTVEVTGTKTDPIEVSSYRNLPRVETNCIRAGALRIVNDGIVGRSKKVVRIIEALNIEGWDWLKRIKQIEQVTNDEVEPMYMEDVIAGRPIFAFPSRVGGFRLRYGRSRNTGLAALGLHPATMIILNNFLASGTQLRVEGPGKGGIVVPVDTIEPPIVKLKNNSVVRVDTIEDAQKIQNNIQTILFLGDLLVGFGEFLENNKSLAASGYVEEWWVQDLQCAISNQSIDEVAEFLGFSAKRLKELVNNPLYIKPTAKEALVLAEKLKIPLHPRFTYFWNDISYEELVILRQALIEGERTIDLNIFKIRFSSNQRIKDILERLAIPHEYYENEISIAQDALILMSCLKIDTSKIEIKKLENTLETVEQFSGILLREKVSTYIGARMGRPEKARKREMSPPVHALFPVGLAGGSHRDILLAAGKGKINVELTRRKCPVCAEITHKLICQNCGAHTSIVRICPRCNRTLDIATCPTCQTPMVSFTEQLVNLDEIYKKACKVLNLPSVRLVKGVRGLTSSEKWPEPLEKGILRAKYDLSVYKDGTIRFDATNAPLTHFTPEEIQVSIEKLRSFGYNHDMHGNILQKLNQMCELKVQDVIIPKTCGEYFLHVAQFIDELLVKVYGLPKFYGSKQREDLLGHMIIGFAPHTSAGIIGRILGFTDAEVCYAHPLWHNIKRRDCDGDEDALMLALDVLLNFSKSYLPAQIGGMMDAPLLLISTIDPYEVDETHNMDVAFSYPLNFYTKTLEQADPKIISGIIDIVEHRLGQPDQFEGYGFTHQTFNINEGNLHSSYMKLGAMSNKLFSQLQLAEMIRAVDAKEVAKKVLKTHLIRDIVGNLTAFTRQKLRCKKCNLKFRRIPLTGKCTRCGGELVFTVFRKGIEKYLDLADELIRKYNIDDYYQQRIALIRDELSLLFKEVVVEQTNDKQVKLGEFM